MSTLQTTLDLTKLKPLTSDQYDAARAKALDRVSQRIGQRPRRDDFKRELAPLWTVLDIIALVVFTAALVVSSVHILSHMGHLAAASYDATGQATAGTVIGRDFFVAVHQWMLIPLAEGSMILFLILFGMTRGGWRKGVYLLLAALAVVFVLVANWQSGIGTLESLLAPAFTIGIGLKLELLIVQSLNRRRDIDARYIEAVNVFEAASQDASQHPDFAPFFRQEIWQALMLIQTNRPYKEAPNGFKVAAVQREQQRDNWAANFENQPTVTAFEIDQPTTPPRRLKNHVEAQPAYEGVNNPDFLAQPPVLTTNGNGNGNGRH